CTQRIVGNRLGGMGLHSRSELKARRQLGRGIKVELMPTVPVGERILLAEVEAIEIAEGERITLVGIVIQVFRERVVAFQLDTVAKALADAHGHPPIKRMRGALGVGHRTQVSEGRSPGIAGRVAVFGNAYTIRGQSGANGSTSRSSRSSAQLRAV